MWKVLRPRLTRKLQKVFWIYLVDNFVISNTDAIKKNKPKIACGLIPITRDNCCRVTDFREEGRVEQYKEKLTHGEIGFYAEHAGKMIGSVWASINKDEQSRVVRGYFALKPDEGLVHDVVTGEQWRGMGVGPFMISEIASLLLARHGLSRIIVDVSVKNRVSLRMMDKTGIPIDHRMLNVSAFGKLVMHVVLRQYA